jgi:predicted Holliday junction resolvase-like endonuclease
MIEDIKAKEEVVQGGKRYRKKAVEGGYLLLEEDIRDLLRLQNELLEKQKELQQTMRLLEGREKVEAEVERYNVRSQLNESLFSEIELESDAIEKLVASLPDHDPRLAPSLFQNLGIPAKPACFSQTALPFLHQRR